MEYHFPKLKKLLFVFLLIIQFSETFSSDSVVIPDIHWRDTKCEGETNLNNFEGSGPRRYHRCVNINGQMVLSSKICAKGLVYDKTIKKCVNVPGNGYALYIDYEPHCPNNYNGLLKHPTQFQYYYICQNSSTIVAKCGHLQLFDNTNKRCQPLPLSALCTIKIYDASQGTLEVPDCKASGRYSLPNECAFYYICISNMNIYYQYIHKCPGRTKYDPIKKYCTYNAKCEKPPVTTPSWVFLEDPYPPCTSHGRFRSPTDCSLYYTCSVKTNGTFYQERFECPSGTIFSNSHKFCVSDQTENCTLSQPFRKWPFLISTTVNSLDNQPIRITKNGDTEITDSNGSRTLSTMFGNGNSTEKEQRKHHTTSREKNYTKQSPNNKRQTTTHHRTSTIKHQTSPKTDKYKNEIIPLAVTSNDDDTSSHRTHTRTKGSKTPGGTRILTRIVTDQYGSTKVVTVPEDTDGSDKDSPHKPRTGHKTHVPRNHTTVSRDEPHGSKRSRSPHGTRIVTDQYGSTKVVTVPGDTDGSDKDSPHKPGTGHKTHVPRNHTTVSDDKPHGSRRSRAPHGTRIVTDQYGSTKVVNVPGDTTVSGNKPHGSRRSRAPHGTRIVTDKYGSTKVVTVPGDTDDSDKDSPHKLRTRHKTHVPRNHTTISGHKPHGSKRSGSPHGTRIVTDQYGSTKVVTIPEDTDDSDKDSPHKPRTGHKTHVPQNHTTVSGHKPHGSKHSRSPHGTKIVTDQYGSTKVVTVPGDTDASEEDTPHKPGTRHKTHVPRNHTTVSGHKPHGSKRSRSPHGTRIVTDQYGSTKVVTIPGDTDDSDKDSPQKPRTGHKTHVPRNHTTVSGDKPHGSRRSRAPHGTRIVTDQYGSTKVVTVPGYTDGTDSDSPNKPGTEHKTHVPRNHTTVSGHKPHGSKRSRSPHRTRIVTDQYGSTKVVTVPGDTDSTHSDSPNKPGTGHKTHVPRNHTTVSGHKPHGSKRSRSPHGTRIVTDQYGSTKVVTIPGDTDDSDKDSPHKPRTGHKTHVPRNHTTVSGHKPHGSKRSRSPHGTRIVTDQYGSTKVVTIRGDTDDSDKDSPQKPKTGHKTHVPRNHTTVSGDKPHGSRRSRAPHGTRIVTDQYGSTKVVTVPGYTDGTDSDSPNKPGTEHKTHVPRNQTTVSGHKPHGSKRSRSPHRTRIVTDQYGSTKVVTVPGDTDSTDSDSPNKPGTGHKTHVPRNHTTVSGHKPHGSKRSGSPHGTRIVTDQYGSTKVVTIPEDTDDSDKDSPHKPRTGHKTHVPQNHTTVSGHKPHGSKHSRSPHGTKIVTDQYGSTKVVTVPGDTDASEEDTPHKPGTRHKTHVPRNHTTVSGHKPHGSKRSRSPHGTRIVTDQYGSTKVVTIPGDTDDSDKDSPQKPRTGHKTNVPRNHTTVSGDKPHGSRRSRAPHGTRIVTDQYGSTKVVTVPGYTDGTDSDSPNKPGTEHKTHVPRNHTTVSGHKPHGSKRSRSPHRTRIVTDQYGSTKVVTVPGDTDSTHSDSPNKPGTGHKTHVPRNHTTVSGHKPHGSKRSRSPHGTRIVTDQYGSTKVVTIPGDTDDSDKDSPHKPRTGHKTHVPRNHTTVSGHKPHGSKRSRSPHGTRIVTDQYGSTKVVTIRGDTDDSDKDSPQKPKTGHKTHVPRNHTTVSGDKPHGSRRSRAPHGTRIVTDQYGSTKVVTVPGYTDGTDSDSPNKPGTEHKTHVPRNQTTVSGHKPHGSKRSRSPHRTRIVTDQYGSTKVVTVPGDTDSTDSDSPNKPGTGHKTHVPRNHTTVSGHKPHGSKRSRRPHGTRIGTDQYGSTKVVTIPGDTDASEEDTPHKPGSRHKTHVPRNHTTISGDTPHGNRRSRAPHRTRIVTDQYGSTRVVTVPEDTDASNEDSPHKSGTRHKTHVPRNHTTVSGHKPHGSKRSRSPHGTRIVTDQYGSTKVVTIPGDTDDSDKDSPQKPRTGHKTHVPRNHTTVSGDKPHGSRRSRAPHGTRIVTDQYGSTKVVTVPGYTDGTDSDSPNKPGTEHKTHVPRNHTTVSGHKPHGSKRSRSPHRTRIVTDQYGSTKVVTVPGDTDSTDSDSPNKPGTGHKTHVPRNHTTVSGHKPHGSKRSRSPHGTRIVTDQYGSTKVVIIPGDTDDSDKDSPHKPRTGHKTHVPRNHTTVSGHKTHGSKRSRSPHGTRIVTDQYGSTKVVTIPGDTDDSDKDSPQKPRTGHKTHVPRNHTTVSGDKPHGSRRSRAPHGTRIVTDQYGSTKVVTVPGYTDGTDSDSPNKPGTEHKTHVPRNHTTVSGHKPHGSKRSRSPHRTRIVTDQYGSTKVVTVPGDTDSTDSDSPNKPGTGHKTHVPRNHTTVSGHKPHGSKRSRSTHGTRIVTDQYGSTKVVTIPGDTDDSDKDSPHKPRTGHKTHVPRNHTTVSGHQPHGSKRSRGPHGTRIVTDQYGSTKVVTIPGDTDDSDKDSPHKPRTGHKTHVSRNHTTVSGHKPHGSKRSRSPHGSRIVTDQYGSTKVVTIPGDTDDSDKDSSHKPRTGHKTHVPRNHTTVGGDKPHGSKRSRSPHGTRIVTDQYGSTKVVTIPGDTDDSDKDSSHKPRTGHKTHVPRNHTTVSGHKPHGSKRSRSPHGTRIVTDQYGSTKVVTVPGDTDSTDSDSPNKPGTGHKTHVPRNHTTVSGHKPHGSKRSRSPHGTRIVTDQYGSTKVVTVPGYTDGTDSDSPNKPGTEHKTHVPRNHTTVSGHKPHGSKRSRSPHRTRIVTDQYGSTKVVTIPGDTDDSDKDSQHKPRTGHKTHVPRNHTTVSGHKPHGSKRSRSPHGTRIVTDQYGSTKVVTIPGDTDDSDKDSPHKPRTGHKTHVPRNHATVGGDKPHGSKRSRSPHGTRIVTDQYGSTKVVTIPGDTDDSDKDSPHKPRTGHKTHVPRNHTTVSTDKPHGSKRSRSPHGTEIVTDQYGSTKVVTVPGDTDASDEDSPHKPGTRHKTHVPRNHTAVSTDKPHGSKRSRSPHGTRIVTDQYGSTKVVTVPGDTDALDEDSPHKPRTGHKTHVPRNHTTVSGHKPHGSKRSRSPHGTRIVTDQYGSTKVVTVPGDTDASDKYSPHKPGTRHITHIPRNHTTVSGHKPHGSKRSKSPHRTRIVTDQYGSTRVVTVPGDTDASDEDSPHKSGTRHKTHVPRNHTTVSGHKPHGSKRSRSPHGTIIVTDQYGSTKVVTVPGDTDDSDKYSPHKPGTGHKTHVPRNHTTVSGPQPHGSKRSRSPHGTRIVTDQYGSTKVVTVPGDKDALDEDSPHKPRTGHKTHVPRNHTTVSGHKPHGSKRSRSPHGTRIVTDQYGSTKVVTVPGDKDALDEDSPHKPRTGHKTHVPRNHTTVSGHKPHGSKRSRSPHGTRIVTDQYGSTRVVTVPKDTDDSDEDSPHKSGTRHKTHVPRNHTTVSGHQPHGSKRSRSPHRTRIVTDQYGSTKVVSVPGDTDSTDSDSPNKPGTGLKTHVPRNHTTVSGHKPHGSKRSRSPHGTRIVTDQYGSTKVVTVPGDTDALDEDSPHKPRTGHKTHVPRNHTTVSGHKPHGSKRSRSPHGTRIVTDQYGSTKVVTIPGDTDDSDKDSPHKPRTGHKTHVPRNHTTVSGHQPHGSKRSRSPHRTRIVTDKYGSTKVVTIPGDTDDSDKDSPHKPRTGHKTHVPRNHTTVSGHQPHGSKRSRSPHGTRIVTDKYGSTKVVTIPGDTDDSDKDSPHKPGTGHKTQVPRNHTIVSTDKPHGSKRSRSPHGTKIVTDQYGSTKVVTVPGDTDASDEDSPHKPGTRHKTHVPRNHKTVSGHQPHGSKRSRSPHGTRIVTDQYGSTKVVTIPGDTDDSDKDSPHKHRTGHKTHVPRNQTTVSGDQPQGSKRSRSPHGTRIVTDQYGSTKVVTVPGDTDASDEDSPHKPGTRHKTHVPRNHKTVSGHQPHGSKRSRSPHGTRIVTDPYGSTKVVTIYGDTDDSDKDSPHKPRTGHKTHVPRNQTTVSGDKPHGSKRSRSPHGTRIVTDQYGSTKVVTILGDTDDSDKDSPHKPRTGHKTHVPRNQTTVSGDKPHGSKRSRSPHGTRIVTDQFGSTKVVTIPGDTDDSDKDSPHKPRTGHKTHVPRNHTTVSGHKPHGNRRSRAPHGTRIVTDQYGSTRVVTVPKDTDASDEDSPHKPGTRHKTHVPRNHTTVSGDKPHGSKRSRNPHGTRIVTDQYGSTKVVTVPGDTDDSDKDSPHKPRTGHKTHVPRNQTTVSGDKPHGSKRSRSPHGTRIVTDQYGSTKVVTVPGDTDASDEDSPHKPGTGHKTHVPRNHTTVSGHQPHGSKRSRSPHGTRIGTDQYGSTKVVTIPGDTDDSDKDSPHKPRTGHITHVPRNHTTVSGDKPHGSKRSRVPHGTRIITDQYGSTKVVTVPGDTDGSDKDSPHKPGTGHKTHVPRNHTTVSTDKPNGSKRSRSPHGTRIVTDQYGSTKVVTIPGDTDDSDKDSPHKPRTGHKNHVPRNHTTVGGDQPHGSKRSRSPRGTRIVTDQYGSTKVVTIPGDTNGSDIDSPLKPGTVHKTHVPQNPTTVSGNKLHGSKHSRSPHGSRIVTDQYGSTEVVTISGNTDDSDKISSSKLGKSQPNGGYHSSTSFGTRITTIGHSKIKESYGTSKIPEISNQKRHVKDTQPSRSDQSTHDHSTHSIKSRRTPGERYHSELSGGKTRSTHTREGHTRTTHQGKTHKDVTHHTRNSTGTLSTKIHQTHKSRVTKVVQITQATDKDHNIVTHPRNRTHQAHKNRTTHAGNHTLAPHTHLTHDYSNATVKDFHFDNTTKIGYTIKIKTYTFLNNDSKVTDIDGKHGGFTESPNCTRSGTFLYSKDCKKYFLCKLGKTTLFDFEIYECKEGLIYSQRYKICVSLNYETCTFEVFVPHFKPPTSPLPSSKEKVNCKDPGIFAFNNSCKSYYICEKTGNKSIQANIQQCPPNTNFDIQYKKCLPEKVSKCNRFDNEIIQTTKSYTSNKDLLKTTTTSNKNNENPVTEVTLKVPKNNTDECPESTNNCPHVGAFRVENSCHEYFECTYDRKCDRLVKTDTLVCPKCLRFNPVVGLCDYPHNVPECSPKMPDKYNCTGPGTFKVSKDCTQYAVCEKTSSGTYKSIRKHCPKSQNFNPSSLQCEENFECFVKKPICTKPGFFVNEHTCELYYQCVELDDDGNFDVVEHECPPNLLFDVEKQYCDFPDKVKGCQIEHHTLKPPLLPKPQ